MASSIILQSNEVSSLQQTLIQSESAEIQYIYNTREIYNPSATSFYNITPVSGTATSGQAVSFQLPKYGFLNAVNLNFTKTIVASGLVAAALDTDQIRVDDYSILKNIDRVEFLSSSRVLYTIYFNSDMACMYADLTNEEKQALDYTAFKNVNSYVQGVATATNASATGTYNIPLHFPFLSRIDCNPMLSFQEPCQIRVVFGNLDTYKATSGAIDARVALPATLTMSDVSLDLRFSMFNEADTASIIQQNYGNEPSLNKLITGRRYRENPSQILKVDGASSSITAGQEHTITMDLRNIDCIQSWNFVVYEHKNVLKNVNGNTTHIDNLKDTFGLDGLYTPLPITSIEILASGQSISTLGANALKYSRISDNGWSTLNDSNFAKNIAKSQVGYNEHDQGGVLSNSTSMRELNNVQAKITFNANPFISVPTLITPTTFPPDINKATEYQAFCSEETVCIESISSSTGRSIISLAN